MDGSGPSFFSSRNNAVIVALAACALACGGPAALSQSGVTMVVIDKMQAGAAPADFEFARTLDDPQLCVFIQDDAHLYQWKPSAIGSDYVIEAVSPFQLVSQKAIPLVAPMIGRPRFAAASSDTVSLTKTN